MPMAVAEHTIRIIMKGTNLDIAIIGGGASGMMSALSAVKQSEKLNIAVFERLDRVGKKILATGNGRCNFSNINTSVSHYHGQVPDFADYPLKEFTVDDTVNFFNTLGVFPREERDGRLYPFSLQASAVLDCLRNELSRRNINVYTSRKIIDIKHKGSVFRLSDQDKNSYTAKSVIIAGGGCASPSLGSDGSAFDLLKSLGHRMEKTYPALVQLRTDTEGIKGLKGIKTEAKVSLIHGDRIITAKQGELLFTDYGISGPPVFDISVELTGKKNASVEIDFMPEYDEKAVFEILKHRTGVLSHLTAENYFVGLLNKRVGNLIARRAGIQKLSMSVSEFTEVLLWKLAANIKHYSLNITGTQGYDNAQVTAGGISVAEFDNKTMESKVISGIFACGEVLDIYGDCGGYNLQWAWSCGYVAGRECALKCLKYRK